MQVRCPECQGRCRMDYKEWPSLPFRPVADDVALEQVTVQVLHDQPCRMCNGSGRIAATERVPVVQHGRRIGTVPPDFDPAKIKSTSWLYSVRPGDFRREGDEWVVSQTLGPGDLEAVPGFVWDRSEG
jgi:hypothetical protein